MLQFHSQTQGKVDKYWAMIKLYLISFTFVSFIPIVVLYIFLENQAPRFASSMFQRIPFTIVNFSQTFFGLPLAIIAYV